MGSPRADRRASRGRCAALALLLLSLVCVDLHSCASAPPRAVPVSREASSALAEARLEQRVAADGWRVRARDAARRALEFEPGWVAAERVLDDLARGDLSAGATLAQRLEALDRQAEVGNDPTAAQDEHERLAREAYLAGRLEGTQGVSRFDAALLWNPGLAWAHHGRAWMRFRSGNAKGALAPGARAIANARDDWERSNFVIAQAQYLLALERAHEAASLLADCLASTELAESDATVLAVWLCRAELACPSEARIERGFWRGIDLLREHDLSNAEVRDLGGALISSLDAAPISGSLEEIEAALAARPGSERGERDRLRADILLERGFDALAFGLTRRVGGNLRIDRLASSGEIRAAVEAWLDTLPQQVLDEDGLPRRAPLRRLVERARTADADDAALGDALLAAGWYAEARGLASNLALRDLDAALDLDARATAGRSVLRGIGRLLDGVDRSARFGGPLAGGDDSAADGVALDSLDDLLRALQPILERHSAGTTPDLVATPRLAYAPVASILHPGPRFSANDARLGLGVEGEAVPGLGAALLEMGRFGIFGQTLGGGGPDGTVLRLLAFEERSGQHLGVPFHGTVAWCDGADVPSRPARLGAHITGAALHEGFWIDVRGVRAELERWYALERDFLSNGGERARVALAAVGPRLRSGLGDSEAITANERARVYAPLGQADRVRLALLAERPAPDAAGASRITLEELLEGVADHEEGHLTDRTRFLPVLDKPFLALNLFAAAGFSPRGLAGMLEYRAQLVALAVGDEPRIPLAECLDGAEGGAGLTPHAAAYGRLLADLLELLSANIADYPALDPDHYLIHQLHRLGAEEVRALAVALARKQGLVRE